MRNFRIIVTALALCAAVAADAQVYAEMLLAGKDRDERKEIQSLTVPGNVDVYNQLHHHGPAFESELVGYRVYFDKRQTVDIYGKRYKGLELAHTQFYPTADDIRSGYGDDVLWAGTTVSVGSLRGFIDGMPTFIEPVERRTESILNYGPDKAVIEVKVEGWQYQGKRINMTQRFTLYAEHRDVRVDVTFDGLSETPAPFCTGVLKFPGGMEFSDHGGLCATWGTNWAYGPKDTLDVHKKATVGVAVCIPPQYVVSEPYNEENLLYLISPAPQVSEKNSRTKKAYAVAPSVENYSLTYYLAFCSAAEEWAGSFHSADEWFRWVKQWKREIMKP
ncbi:MAG: DUF4861 family protein [Bacteroidaceae bacterium]|nr:DUF4861 family protein [Bacteroidaceae bacterium]